ncbi:MAG: UDP-N-acetylglucosamine--N-acetylmuramyl-(pentapeptide) pyrophosphoryl-undecaprenol N-acetylglucosamine transferase [Chlamydiia bacterium]|nr:UDP-N-acetylglucosamine--N-acetylmuramyl-(pentapeptide) pyrophosphoryl-undecaprenol N-acetylglucosamine transferase [Chlamydiia bacterium]
MESVEKKPPICIAAGGTAGHLIPAQCYAKEHGNAFFVGHKLSENRFLDREKYPYYDIASAPSLRRPWPLAKGFFQSVRILRRMRPRLVVGFGSYHSLPVLAAAIFLRIPIRIYESNIRPGKINRAFIPFAERVYIHFDGQTEHIRKGVEHKPLSWGYHHFPLSVEVQKVHRKEMGLDPNLFTFLVFGGSQGAQAVNGIWLEALAHLSRVHPPFQVIHLTGKHTPIDGVAAQYEMLGIRALVMDYVRDLGPYWQMADLFVARSGAMTLRDALHFGVPGLMVPLPHAAENHQYHNAHYFQEVVGGGRLIHQRDLATETLLNEIEELIENIDQYRQKVQECGEAAP